MDEIWQKVYHRYTDTVYLYHWRASFKEEALHNQNQVNRMTWPSDINRLLASPLLAPGAEMEL